MPAKNHKADEQTFESAIERLEAIVEQMENNELALEEMLVRYEEGVKLVKLCTERLDAAEKRIEIISRDAAGRATLAPFERESKAASPTEEVQLF